MKGFIGAFTLNRPLMPVISGCVKKEQKVGFFYNLFARKVVNFDLSLNFILYIVFRSYEYSAQFRL